MAGAHGSDAGAAVPRQKLVRAFHSLSQFLRSHDEMDHAVRRGDEEAIEVFAQLLDFVAAWDAVNFQKRRGRFGVVRLQFQPDIGMTKVRYAINPKPVWTKLKNAAVLFFLDQG